MTVTVALTSACWDELCAALDDERETAGVIAARVVVDPDGVTLLARSLSWAPQETYLARHQNGLSLSSAGWVPAMRAALAGGNVPVFVHTHPRSEAFFSSHDDKVDESLSGALPAMGGDGRYAAIVVAGTRSAPTIAGRLYANGSRVEADKFRIVGDGLKIMLSSAGHVTGSAETFERQIRMFGPAGQQILGALGVGVVGAGGTGSVTAEQLTRLGVGTLTIIDDDVVTDPTPTRGYGMTVADVGRSKADVLAEHLRKIGLGTCVYAVTAAVQDEVARTALARADVIFSCVDGHGARLVLNRWAYAHLVPVLDLAILVTAAGCDGSETNIDGRVTWLAPGAACLLCRGRIDPGLAYAEMLEPEERKRLAGEGYVQAVETRQPAVVTLTSLVSSLATTELLQRLFGFADLRPTEFLALVQRREFRRNRTPQRPGCFCSDQRFLGRGTQPPHLDLMWPE